jgi:queuosine precursor transporter
MAQRNYRYFDFVMAAFVTILLCSNVIGASKVCTVDLPVIGELTFGAAVLFFPISYLFGDILTEVYGYARSRRVVWAGFVAMIFATFMSWFVLWLPAAKGWPHQAAFETAFGSTWRIVAASLVAYTVGEFLNSFTLAKMKIRTKGKKLWARTIGSTIVGEAVDSVIFYPLAFVGLWPAELILKVMLSSYLIKVGWEALMTPFTYQIVGFLKRAEKEDYFDYDTNFTPFSLRT